MHYEIYLDSLFLLNFTMNLYLLFLVNKSLHRTATRFRMFLGAVIGGAGYCIMLLLPFGAVLKLIAALACSSGGMLVFVFRPGGVKAFLKVFETMLLYALLLGGGMLLLRNHLIPFRKHMMSVTGVLAFGGILMLLFYGRTGRREQEKQKMLEVRLIKENGEGISVQAIVDTGNSLREPISGKPVSVLDREAFDRLWQDGKAAGFRAIPYHSVGCMGGIMKGYTLFELRFELDGIWKCCRNVYIGVSEQAVSSSQSYQMLLHPDLLKK